jgi:hypothetical protein
MWTQKVLNPQLIKSLFGDENLSLERIEMHEIKLIVGVDLLCVMSFDLEHYLQKPPVKWIQKGFNTVQMQLSFINSTVDFINLGGSSQTGALLIDDNGPGFIASYLSGDSSRLSIGCNWIHVDKIEGYCRYNEVI